MTEHDFFFGFFRCLVNPPMERETLSFNFDSASARGAAQAKLIILQKSLGILYNDVKMFLPKSLFTNEGTPKIEIEINALSKGERSHIKVLNDTARRLVGLHSLKFIHGQWKKLGVEYKVPKSAVLEGLHKTKTIKVKNASKAVVKKPKRPSKRIEVYSQSERIILKKAEKAFDQYSDMVKALPQEIPVKDIGEIRKTISGFIREMWLCVEKTSAVITKRRLTLLTYGSDKKNDKDLTAAKVKAAIDKLATSQWYDVKDDVLLLGPKNLLLRVCHNSLAGDINRVELSRGGLRVDDDLFVSEPDYVAVFNEYRETFSVPDLKPRQSVRRNIGDSDVDVVVDDRSRNMFSDLPVDKQSS